MDNNLDLQYALDADIETAFDSFVDAIYDEASLYQYVKMTGGAHAPPSRLTMMNSAIDI